MKTIKCDRCGKDIPYAPPFMDAVKECVLPPILTMAVWRPNAQKLREVDLCDDCQRAVYDYIFDYRNGTVRND